MLFAILVFFTQVCVAQAYKYISMEDGLGSQKVYRILQDSLGYMWFLTQEGPDRYNGKEIKHYELTDKGQKLNMQFSLNWLYMADDGVLWGTGRKGRFSAMNRAGIGSNRCICLLYRKRESLRRILHIAIWIIPDVSGFAVRNKWHCSIPAQERYRNYHPV